MTEQELRDKIIGIVLDVPITGIKIRELLGGVATANSIADALISAEIGDVSEYKKYSGLVDTLPALKGKECISATNTPSRIIQLYNTEEVERTVKERDEYKHRAEMAEAENTELKARLERAVELPCKIGDRIWVIVGNKYVWGRKVECISMRGNSIIFELYDKTGWKYIESVYLNDYKKTWFTDRTEAEARLAKLRCNI